MYLPTPLSRDDTIIWTNTMLGIEVIIMLLLQCAIVYNIIRKEPESKKPEPQAIKSTSHLYSFSLYENPFVNNPDPSLYRKQF